MFSPFNESLDLKARICGNPATVKLQNKANLCSSRHCDTKPDTTAVYKESFLRLIFLFIAVILISMIHRTFRMEPVSMVHKTFRMAPISKVHRTQDIQNGAFFYGTQDIQNSTYFYGTQDIQDDTYF